jgi:hypothetical protein
MNKKLTAHIRHYFFNFLIVWLSVTVTSLILSSCGSQGSVAGTSTDRNSRKVLLRDEGLSQLSYVNFANPEANWHVGVPPGRDIQLVGKSRVLIGTGTGYEEREIPTGKKVFELTSFEGTIAARRLRSGNTLLVGLNWQGREGIVLVEVDAIGNIKQLISYPGFSYVRLVRETVAGTFLVTADDLVFEGKNDGSIIWKASVVGRKSPHAWQALRLSNGRTVVSTGFAANFQVFASDGKLVDSISGPANVKPHFFAGFQILNNGNLVVTNWQGHGPNFGNSGLQLLEYTPAGELAWSWKQDATKFSSLQGVIVLDRLDLNLLHVEDANGKLVPIPTP